MDSTGKVYASGVIYGSGNFNFGDSVVIAGPYTRYNLLLVQYNSTDGETQWAKSALSGLDESQYSAVVVDSSDNINVVGTIKEDGEGFDQVITYLFWRIRRQSALLHVITPLELHNLQVHLF